MIIHDLVFVTTSASSALIQEFISSISNNRSLDLLVLVVAQGAVSVEYEEDPFTAIRVLETPCLVSLSLARNIAREYLSTNDVGFRHIMFPDDDSTFDRNFFDHFKSVVVDGCCYLIDVKNVGGGFFIKPTLADGQVLSKKDWHKACSVNMIIDYRTYYQVGPFDENLGVGAKYGAGEDSDFFLRSISTGCTFKYTNKLYNYHPSSVNRYAEMSLRKLIMRFNSYGKGVVFLLCKHGMYKKAFIACLRAYGGVINSTIQGRPKLVLAYLYSSCTRFIVLFQAPFINRYRKIGSN